MNVTDENVFIHHFSKKNYEIFLDMFCLHFYLTCLWGKMLAFVSQIVSPDFFFFLISCVESKYGNLKHSAGNYTDQIERKAEKVQVAESLLAIPYKI